MTVEFDRHTTIAGIVCLFALVAFMFADVAVGHATHEKIKGLEARIEALEK